MHLSTYLTNADAYPQFIVSKLVKGADGHTTKLPCNQRGLTADHKDPANWRTLSWTEEHVQRLGPDYRVGFSITAESKFFLLDIDKALIDGKWSQLATDLCIAFDGCYIEVSQSGTGLHILGRYTGEFSHKNKNTPLGIELYTKDRFVLFGAIHPKGDWNKDATPALKTVIAQYFVREATDHEEEDKEVETNVNLTDEALIAKLRNKVSPRTVFGNMPSFSDLYDGNVEALVRAYPPQSEGKAYDASAADQALSNMLGTYGAEAEQITRIMWTSNLVRDKWSEHKTYLLNTVQNTISSRDVMHLSKTESNSSHSGSQQLLDGMPQEFEGCYYIKSEREVYTLAHGLLSKDSFNICYMVPYQKVKPYAQFENLARASDRIIDHLGFKPNLSHGTITEREGEKSINTYRPIPIKMRQGDVSLILKLLDAMYPNKRDQRIILSYAAALVQRPGIKAQWCIILQGTQGCGKTLLVDLISYAVGLRYTHKAKADEFENRFNDQWRDKKLIAIEDPNLKGAKLEDLLKPLITQDRLCFEGKGKNARMGDFAANFIGTLNNFDYLQKRKDTRRFAVFMSALQSTEDKINAGMTDTFYSNLVKWINEEGNEFFAYFLHNYQIDPAFDFSGVCVTAPHTSTTDNAIEASRNEIELMILEEIELRRIGFRKKWISSFWLSEFLNEKRIRHLMPDNKRGAILKELGYYPHEGLQEGRASRNVEPDNKRPTLFVTKDHPSLKLTDKEQVVKAYELDQKED